MEPKETAAESITEEPAATAEANSNESKEVSETTKSVTSASEAITDVTPPIDDSLKVSFDILNQVKELWEQYFGEGKKANRILAIAIIATIPVLVATSELLGFLNKLPVLPSVFELVGFVYSVWFVYRYLLLANTRKELIDGITTWKNKVFG